MYLEPSSITVKSLRKSSNILADLNNNKQNIDEGQYGHTKITLVECFDDKDSKWFLELNKRGEQVNCFLQINLLKTHQRFQSLGMHILN